MLITIENILIIITIFATVMAERTAKLSTDKPKHRKIRRTTVALEIESTTKYHTTQTREPEKTVALYDILRELINEDDDKKLEFINDIKEILGVQSSEEQDNPDKYMRSDSNREFNVEAPAPQIPLTTAPFISVTAPPVNQGLPNIIPQLLYLNALQRGLIFNQGRFMPLPTLFNLPLRDLTGPGSTITPQSLLQPQITQLLQNQNIQRSQQSLPTKQNNQMQLILRSNENSYPYEPLKQR